MNTMEKTEGETLQEGCEKCVVCGAETEYALDTPIGERQFFVESKGQLCQKCYQEIYEKNKDDDMTDVSTEKDLELEKEKFIASDEFDYKIEYPDAFYENYIKNFIPNKKKRWGYRFLKRSFDIIVSFIALIILSPIMLCIAIWIKCDSKGPIIFKQKRIGRNEEVFNCYKFRTMKIDAPRECATSLLENPDQYYTRIGKTLRRLSLDELPQLWNVFIGTMSFIGYRPLILTEEKCNEMRSRLGVFAVRPGISGYAQVCGRDDVYYKNKAILDAEYVKKASIWLDLKLIFQTVVVVLKREGNKAEEGKKKKKKSKKATAQEVKETERKTASS